MATRYVPIQIPQEITRPWMWELRGGVFWYSVKLPLNPSVFVMVQILAIKFVEKFDGKEGDNRWRAEITIVASDNTCLYVDLTDLYTKQVEP